MFCRSICREDTKWSKVWGLPNIRRLGGSVLILILSHQRVPVAKPFRVLPQELGEPGEVFRNGQRNLARDDVLGQVDVVEVTVRDGWWRVGAGGSCAERVRARRESAIRSWWCRVPRRPAEVSIDGFWHGGAVTAAVSSESSVRGRQRMTFQRSRNERPQPGPDRHFFIQDTPSTGWFFKQCSLSPWGTRC